MHVINARNVNDAFIYGVALLDSAGALTTSRAGSVIEMPVPVTTVYTCPTERVLFNPIRRANPFFHLMEALWILGGRNDVAFLEKYNPRMAEFSDGQGVFHAAYGDRLRHHFGFDQLQSAMRLLKAFPDTRRAVLQIWSAPDDLDADRKDLPCLGGKTPISSPQGDVTIAALAERFKNGTLKQYPVYGVEPSTGDVQLTWCTNAWCSGNKPVREITFDDNSTLRVTADHKMYRRDWVRGDISHARKRITTEVQAGDLRIGDSVLATTLTWKTPKGHFWVKKNVYRNTSYSNRQTTHRAYWELVHGSIPDGKEIHHTDYDKLNNCIENLICIDKGQHSAHHRQQRNPMHHLTKEQRTARAKKQSASLKAFWAKIPAEHRKIIHKPPSKRTSEEQAICENYNIKGIGKHRTKHPPLDDRGNHKIIAIRDLPPEPVYDFTVPTTHTAIVGTGIVVHNCNDMIFLKIRDSKLHITVANRSNDLVWGLYGANAVQFSILQEYMAAWLGIGVGTYRHVSDSLHAYLDGPAGVAWGKVKKALRVQYVAPYSSNTCSVVPLAANFAAFDKDLRRFFSAVDRPSLRAHGSFNSEFFNKVAIPMYNTHAIYREEGADRALAYLTGAGNDCKIDWLMAAHNWLLVRAYAEARDES